MPETKFSQSENREKKKKNQIRFLKGVLCATVTVLCFLLFQSDCQQNTVSGNQEGVQNSIPFQVQPSQLTDYDNKAATKTERKLERMNQKPARYDLEKFVWVYIPSDVYLASKKQINLQKATKQNNNESTANNSQSSIKQKERSNLAAINQSKSSKKIIPIPLNQHADQFRYVNMLNIRDYSEKDNYKLMVVDEKNYTKHLSKNSVKKIKLILQKIRKNLQNSTLQRINDYENAQMEIKQKLIIYHLLLENGGIFIDGLVSVVQTFSTWLENIMESPFINIGDKINSSVSPKCFGFFNLEMSSFRDYVNIKRQFQFEKKLNLFPSVEDYFLACSKRSEYIDKLIQAYIDILLNGDRSETFLGLNKHETLIGKVNATLKYTNSHLLANHAVLQERQRELDQMQDQSSYRRLAIDSFGLITINSNLGPRKIESYFPDWNSERGFAYLSKQPIQDLERHTGKIRYIHRMQEFVIQRFMKEFNKTTKNSSIFFAQNSFIDIFYLSYMPTQAQKGLGGKAHLVKPPILKIVINQTQNLGNPLWHDLPKHLWVIWDDGLRRNSSFLVEICHQNLKKSAQNSGIQLHIVTNSNINSFLSTQTIKRITAATSKSSKIGKQMISDIWRLALIMEHGGIYVDATTFTIDESFDWVKNLTRLPSNHIWNRYGSKPDIFMFWNTYYANQMMEWTYDAEFNTKKAWLLSYQSNFIAAIKKCPFVIEWFDLFLQWIVLPFEQIEPKIIELGMIEHSWINQNQQYLLVMEAVKYVNGRRQKMLRDQKDKKYRNAADYYKIWSIPGQMTGQLKFRLESEHESKDYRLKGENYSEIYRLQFPLSYVQSVDGPVTYQAKFFSQGLSFNKTMVSFYYQNQRGFKIETLEKLVHPKSLVGSKLLYKYPEKTLYFLSYYTNQVNLKLKYGSSVYFSF